jgi:2-polyprenyl-3-methyl-5-hydroxy-6-metoxy-1,4-benzoquinol methylase
VAPDRREHQQCYVCGSDRLTHKFVVKGFTIVRCSDCSLQFVKERLSQDELKPYYEREDQADAFVYKDPTNLSNLNYYYYKLRDLIGGHMRPGRILDVGCSSGQFLDVMEGWERYGIEMMEAYAQKAIAKYGRHIQVGTLDDYQCEAGFFDAIALQDVFDHVRDPLATLRACHRLLRPGGLIVIKVHNVSCLYARLTGSRFYAFLPPVHLSYFNKKSLRVALSRTGFSTLYHRYIGHVLSLKTVAYRLSDCGSPGLFGSLYVVLKRSPLGNVPIRKNLNDIITIVAEKRLVKP